MAKHDPNKIPRHIAFVMDGNGRWATRRGLPRAAGHKVGYDKLKMAIKRCAERGIGVVSVYAFSTENWKRPQQEIDGIFKIIRQNMDADISLFNEWNVRISTMGDLTKFPKDIYEKFLEIKDQTKNNTGIILNICANYGGRSDIVTACNKLLSDGRGSITEEDITKNLYGADLPPLDLVVRTSNEQRLSNFMIWQMAYSELLFIKPHWPAMTPKIIDKCIKQFQKRNRRFGTVK